MEVDVDMSDLEDKRMQKRLSESLIFRKIDDNADHIRVQ